MKAPQVPSGAQKGSECSTGAASNEEEKQPTMQPSNYINVKYEEFDDTKSVNSSISNNSKNIHKEKKGCCKIRKKKTEMQSHNPRQGQMEL